MLHPLNVVAYEAEMMRLVQFQRDLLELAIHLKNGDPKNEDTFQRILGNEVGSWFWSKHEEQSTTEDGTKQASVWRKKFDELCLQCPHTANFQQAILDAFDWDIEFHLHLTDMNWSFKYPQLPASLKKAIKELFEHCYTYLGGTGYDKAFHGNTELILTRDFFLKGYEVANPNMKVCPVCDVEVAKHPDKQTFLLTLDHYFAKSEYPFLSLHPGNLVPTCSICNSIFKLAKSLLIDATTQTVPDDALLNTYHSYFSRAILDLDSVYAHRPPAPANELKVTIADSNGTSARRIKSANRVFRLMDRWRQILRDSIYERLVDELSCQAEENPERTAVDLLKDLRIERKKCNPGSNSYDVLKVAYLEYALADATEQKYLLERYTGNEQNAR